MKRTQILQILCLQFLLAACRGRRKCPKSSRNLNELNCWILWNFRLAAFDGRNNRLRSAKVRRAVSIPPDRHHLAIIHGHNGHRPSNHVPPAPSTNQMPINATLNTDKNIIHIIFEEIYRRIFGTPRRPHAKIALSSKVTAQFEVSDLNQSRRLTFNFDQRLHFIRLLQMILKYM